MTAIKKSVVIFEPLETRCDNKIVAWYYLRRNGRMYCRPQAPGVEARIKEDSKIVAVWGWDGSWSKWWEMLIEAWALGLCHVQLKKLAEARGCDNANALFLAKNFGFNMYQETGPTGTRYIVSTNYFNTSGRNYLEAMGKLCVKLGYVGHPDTTLHFFDLLRKWR